MWSLFSYKVIKVSKNDEGLYEWQAAALWAHGVPRSLMQGLYSVNNEHSFLLYRSEDRRQSCWLVMSLQRSVYSCRHLQCSISTRWKMWHACKAWCRLLRTKFTGGISSTEQTNQNSCGLCRLDVWLHFRELSVRLRCLLLDKNESLGPAGITETSLIISLWFCW